MGDLTKNFSRREFECPCCGYNKVSRLLVAELQVLRDRLGKPIIVTSGCRCKAHNSDVGGVKDSQHTYGAAADIVVRGVDPREVAREAATIASFRHGGIGVYNTYIHLDVRDRRARWGIKWK